MAFASRCFAASDPGIAHERGFAIVGRRWRRRSPRFPKATLRAGWQLSYWLQMLTVFAFLVLLPLGEHFHIVTALPGAVLRRRPARQRVPSVDLDRVMNAADGDGRDGRACARRATSPGRTRYDAFTCTECGRCKDACPTFLTGKPLVAQVGERQPEEASASNSARRSRRRSDGGVAARARRSGHQRRRRCGRARPAAIAKRPARSSSSTWPSSSGCASIG